MTIQKNGVIIFYSNNQAALYRAAALVGRKVCIHADDHKKLPLLGGDYSLADLRFLDRLNHENANSIVYDVEDDEVYFEEQLCEFPIPGFYPNDGDWGYDEYIASSPYDFAMRVKSLSYNLV